MSELKVYDIDLDYPYNENNGSYYIKSEADKVIEEKDKELRHQKYKRCLAMAEWCSTERDIYNLTPKFAKVKFFEKWHNRWLELAEKFNEAK